MRPWPFYGIDLLLLIALYATIDKKLSFLRVSIIGVIVVALQELAVRFK